MVCGLNEWVIGTRYQFNSTPNHPAASAEGGALLC